MSEPSGLGKETKIDCKESLEDEEKSEEKKMTTKRPFVAFVKDLLWRSFRILAIAYLSVVFLMSFLETMLVYPTPAFERSNWNPTDSDHEEAWFLAADNSEAKVHGWYFDQPGADYAVLYCHGNGEQVADNFDLMQKLRSSLNASVLVFDYRGYGKSAGKPNEAGVIADGLAAQSWLAERTNRSVDEIVIVGRSLGGGVATALAQKQGAAALILQSTFTRMTDAAAHHYPWLPVRWVMRNRFNSIDRIAEIECPLLISHGTNDEVIPYRQSLRLYETSGSAIKQHVELAGTGHNDPQPEGYYDELRDFLAKSRVP